MTGRAVVIAGGGPTGLMLAGELALAGIDVAIVERRASQELDGSRSRGLQSRTIEVLDQRGIAGRFLAEGQTMQVLGFAGILLDISDFPSRHNYVLALWQSHFERILAAWVSELGVPIAREREVTGFTREGTGVDVELSDGQLARAERPWCGTPAARAPHARSRPGHRQRPAAGLHPAARGPAGSAPRAGPLEWTEILPLSSGRGPRQRNDHLSHARR